MRLTVHDPAECLRSSEDRREGSVPERCLVFGGGAWQTCFFLGLYEYLQQAYSAEELLTRWAFCGESAGTLFALGLAVGVPVSTMYEMMQTMAEQARSVTAAKISAKLGAPSLGRLGMVGNSMDFAAPAFWRLLHWLPEDELIARLRGRFAITFTSLNHGRLTAIRADQFESAAEIFEACAGSAHIPIVSFGISALAPWKFPRVGGMAALDGGFTACGAVPVLPCHAACYAISCGEGDAELLARSGLTVDVQPATVRPVATMFITPESDAHIAETAQHGYDMAKAFFESRSWQQRVTKAQQQAAKSRQAAAAASRSPRSRPTAQRRRSRSPRAAARGAAPTQTPTTRIAGGERPRAAALASFDGLYIQKAMAAVPLLLLLASSMYYRIDQAMIASW